VSKVKEKERVRKRGRDRGEIERGKRIDRRRKREVRERKYCYR
jgi:hypothetical protein